MDDRLNIAGLFKDDRDLAETVRKRKICYDTEPYYINRKGQLLQIGFQLNLYGTFQDQDHEFTPEDQEYHEVERDVIRLAEALAKTCNPLHMCESTTIDPSTVTYAPERKMRQDITVHIPIFDQKNFGHPVDDAIRGTVTAAAHLLEAAGVRKTSWRD